MFYCIFPEKTQVCSRKLPQTIAKIHSLTLSWWSCSHIETSPLICSANQWTCFYMITAFIMKELNFPLFLPKRYFLKIYKKVLEGRLISFSWTKRFAFLLTTKSANLLNYQNGLCFGGIQVRYFLWLTNMHKYVNMLKNKYCIICKKTETYISNKLIHQDL